MKTLNLSVVTYVPEFEVLTKMESVDKLIPSLITSIRSSKLYKDHCLKTEEIIIKLTIYLNGKVTPQVLEHFQDYLGDLRHFIYVEVIEGEKVLLPEARNAIIKQLRRLRQPYEDDQYLYQFDDDDRVPETYFDLILTSIISNIIDSDKLTFFLFVWERLDGDFVMPKDLKIRELNELYKSAFTFSSWNWITKLDYLIDNSILYPQGFINSPKLEDNYFHLRSCLVNNNANLILNIAYIWNNRDNLSSMSNSARLFIDDLTDYLKTGSVGYEINQCYHILAPNEYAYVDNKSYLKRLTHNLGNALFLDYLGNELSLEYDEFSRTYYHNGRVVTELMPLQDYITNRSLFQFRLLSELNIGSRLHTIFIDSTEFNERNHRVMKSNHGFDLANIYLVKFT